ncbi:hypothetical protein [Haliangium ochraceum]|uniref:Lipoprotein n=1 Tax=Haliangium ochraceum (strain DSM 14365 / JCM 11303 / SMP-2) TaxID=502025 RepID=D0LL16_HALO1|nr:hypothetical protein [Haliangium ochraceum]ACY16736.1 hypothetical protein Hoch_4239 [Haliangium ochraceum DSM 14365]
MRTKTRSIRAALAVGSLALAVSGCGDDGYQPTAEDYDDVATGVGSLVATGELASIEDSVAAAQGIVPFGFSADAEGVVEGSRAGVSYEYELACEDASGASLSACDETTDTATIDVEWFGSLDLNIWQFEVSHTGQWSLSGLQSGTVVFSGEGTFDVSSRVQSLDGQRQRAFDLSYAGSYDIRFDLDADAVSEGDVQYAINAQRRATGPDSEVDAEFDISAEVSFDGSGSASLVLDGSVFYDIDLATGAVTSAE